MFSTEQIRQDLRNECLRLNISRGRIRNYVRYLEEYEHTITLSDEQLMAAYESFDLWQILRLWRCRLDDFPSLEYKFKKVVSTGSDTTDLENPSESTNRSRNDAFSILLAGKFLDVGYTLLQVETRSLRDTDYQSDVDFTIERYGSHISVECKRPTEFKNIAASARTAKKQIEDSSRNGIIAIDCSLAIRPKHHLFENSDTTPAATQFLDWMQRFVVMELRSLLSTRLIGIILHCRVPTMTPTVQLGSKGDSLYRRDCVTSWIFIPNHWIPQDIELMYEILDRFRRCSNDEETVPLSSLYIPNQYPKPSLPDVWPVSIFSYQSRRFRFCLWRSHRCLIPSWAPIVFSYSFPPLLI